MSFSQITSKYTLRRAKTFYTHNVVSSNVVDMQIIEQDKDVHSVDENKRTAKFVSLVTSVATVIITITLDGAWQTQIVGTLEVSRCSAC